MRSAVFQSGSLQPFFRECIEIEIDISLVGSVLISHQGWKEEFDKEQKDPEMCAILPLQRL